MCISRAYLSTLCTEEERADERLNALNAYTVKNKTVIFMVKNGNGSNVIGFTDLT